jgi:FkbM family methyltransferase
MINIKEIVQSLLLSMNLKPCKLSTYVNLTTSSKGCRGAADVFSYYIKNYEIFSRDEELKSFMLFYVENFIKSSSQWSQDIFALYASKQKRRGLFLEIGGADGFTHSNTYSLEKYFEWKGMLIEPDRSQFRLLQASRPSNVLLNVAVSPNDKKELLDLRIVGQLSALQGYEGCDMHLEKRMKSRHVAKVKGISLSQILRENHFDFFSLDVEGGELDIIKNLKWDSINKPPIVTIEHNFREDDRREIVSQLVAQGYSERFASYDWLRRGEIWATL